MPLMLSRYSARISKTASTAVFSSIASRTHARAKPLRLPIVSLGSAVLSGFGFASASILFARAPSPVQASYSPNLVRALSPVCTIEPHFFLTSPQSQRPYLSRILLAQAARQLWSWLIFIVRQKSWSSLKSRLLAITLSQVRRTGSFQMN